MAPPKLLDGSRVLVNIDREVEIHQATHQVQIEVKANKLVLSGETPEVGRQVVATVIVLDSIGVVEASKDTDAH